MLQQRVLDAFQTLGIQPTCDYSAAATAYKRLALAHHPDRNYGDPTANARFQDVRIGEAWSICQRHFEHPASSEVPGPEARGGFGAFNSGRTHTAEDDAPFDEYEAAEFFRFMFEEMLFQRFSHARAQRFRSQRARAGANGGGVHVFSGRFAESQRHQEANARAAFEKRVREFECEQAELDRRAHEAQTQAQAFRLAEEGKGTDLRNLVESYALDVNKRRKLNLKDVKAASSKVPNFKTILHNAAGACDVATVDWLLEKGANAAALDPSLLTPFHVAILRGNTPVARHFLSLFRNTKSTHPRYQEFRDGCHPSKATKDKSGSTPLQLAIRSGNADMVDLLLKEATVHDVEKCWKMLSQAKRAGPIGDVLQTKMKQSEEDAREEAERQVKREAEEKKLREAEKERARLAREAAARQETECRARLAAEAQADQIRQEVAREAQLKEKEAAKQKAKAAAARQRELELAAAAKAEAEAALARREAEARQAEQERVIAQHVKQQAKVVERDRVHRQAEAARQQEQREQQEAAICARELKERLEQDENRRARQQQQQVCADFRYGPRPKLTFPDSPTEWGGGFWIAVTAISLYAWMTLHR